MPPRRGEARAGVPRQGSGAGRVHHSGAAALFLTLAVLLVVPAVRKGLSLWRTVPARVGRVTVTQTCEALVVRQEEVLFADLAGRVTPVAREGERVPRGALVARVAPPGGDEREGRRLDDALVEAKNRAILDEQSPLARRAKASAGARGASAEAIASARRALEGERAALAKRVSGREQLVRTAAAGTVSFAVDGLEGVLGPESLSGLLNEAGPVSGAARGSQITAVKPGEEVVPGQPVAKVVDNFQVWFVVDFPEGEARTQLPPVGRRLRLRLQGAGVPSGATFRATLTARRDGPGRSRLVLAPVEYWPEFGRLRRTTVEVRLGEYEGVIIPRSALVKRGEATGVAVESWLGRVFQEVTVRGGDSERVVVDGLAPGTRVWKNPGTE